MTVSIAQGFGFEKEWLEDGIYNIEGRPDIFDKENNEEAQSIFGIGKNKVEALETWLRSIEVIEKFGNGYRLSPLGRLIKEYDQFFKLDGTWWAIHIILSMKKAKVDLWNYYSNYWTTERAFSRKELFEFFIEKCILASERSIKNGMNAVLSAMLNTPIGNLGVITKLNDNLYIRRMPDISSIHPAIIAFGIARWAENYKRESIQLKDLSNEIDSIGRILLISQYSIRIFLDRIIDMYDKRILTFSGSAGYNTIDIRPISSNQILKMYYQEVVNRMDPHEALKEIL